MSQKIGGVKITKSQYLLPEKGLNKRFVYLERSLNIAVII